MTDRILRAAQGRAHEGENGLIDFVASTDSVDRYNSIIMQFWDTSAFDGNPLFLWMHSYRELPIGRVEAFATEDDRHRSIASVMFDDGPIGQETRRLYVQGFLNAVSVGFMPGSWDITEAPDGDYVWVYGSSVEPNELYELSGVTVPGNADALKIARSRGLIENLDAFSTEVVRRELGRNADATDVELVTLGASPEMLAILRSYDARFDRIEALVSLSNKQERTQPDPPADIDAQDDEVVLVLIETPDTED